MVNNKQHLVLISGGLGSFETARRVIKKYGKDSADFWFFDTLIEDEDLYRFLVDIEQQLDIKITRFIDGRTPWDVFIDEKYIGNSRVDLCSKHLKRLYLERELRRSYPNKEKVTLYFGLDWSEEHRIKAMRPRWEKKGYNVDFPLVWDPWISSDEIKKITATLGIRVPRLYEMGFPHNNCGGACIKAGIYQWKLLYSKFPERYLWHEEKEQEFRKKIGKDVSILRSRKGGVTRPITLKEIRYLIETSSDIDSRNTYNVIDESSCSCFVNFVDAVS